MKTCTRPDPVTARRRLRWVHMVGQLGDGAFYVTAAVHLVRQGASPTGVGLTLAVAWGTGALLAPRVGRLADRFGVRRLSVATLTAAAATLLLLAVAPPALCGIILAGYAVAQSAWGGLRATLVEVVTEADGRVTERAAQQRLGNAALAVGAALGGLALTQPWPDTLRGVFVFDAVAYALAAFLVASGMPEMPPTPRRTPGARLDARHWLATAGAAALYLYMPMLSVALPVMVAVTGTVPAWTASACLAANTLGVLALQGRAAAAVRDVRSVRSSLVTGSALLAVSAALIWTSVGTGRPLLLVPGMLIQVVGEVRFAAGAWDVGYRIAPSSHVAAWQSTYGAAVPLARCFGPALLAPAAAHSGGWALAAAAFVIGGLTLAAATALRPRTTPHPFRSPATVPARPATTRS